GSYENIAGISNPEGNVLGMMPHPERAFHPWQGLNKRQDGKEIFEGMLEYIKRR
ncbi:MAG: phosphoribosylformylglycinamidine synthase, partial [Thermoplasmata archaeon]